MLGQIKRSLTRLTPRRDERGAEMIEFAFVAVLLIALVYGIVSVGITLAAKSTITQAAEDGARAGIVASTPAAAILAAETQASSDLGWMGQGACTPSGSTITCVAAEAACASNAANQCLTVTVSYNYATHPLFPVMPGLGILAPNTITSKATLQVSTPTS